jgi:hypothetical protein
MSPLKSSFWKSYWIALRRAHNDAHARAFLFKTTLPLLVIAAYLLFFLFIHMRFGGNIWNVVFYIFIFGTGAIALVLLRRALSLQDETLKFSLNTPAPTAAQTA